MDYEEITVKDIVRINKIRKLEEKLLLVLHEERLEIYKLEECEIIILASIFNVFTTILASDINDGLFKIAIIQSLIEDLKIEVVRKLEIFEKNKCKEDN